MIRFIIKNNFDSGLCTYTTSIDALRDYINKVYEFDDTIVEDKKNIFKLYFVYELAKNIGFSVKILKTNLSENLNKLYSLNYKKKISYNLNDEDIVIKDEFFEESNIVVKINTKSQVNSNILNKIEKLYLKVKDETLKRYILEFNINTLLPISKVYINTEIYEREEC